MKEEFTTELYGGIHGVTRRKRREEEGGRCEVSVRGLFFFSSLLSVKLRINSSSTPW